MKAKTSVTLEAALLSRIDRVLHANESRSAFFTDAVQQLAEKRERDQRDRRDLALLNANAAALNKEVQDDLDLISATFQEHGETQP